MSIRYFNRYTQALEDEAIYGDRWLKWAYNTRLGKITTRAFLKRAFFSHWYGWRMSLPWSRSKVIPFIRNYNIKQEEFLKASDNFKSFNDFFYRELKPQARPINSNSRSVTLPADGRHLGFMDINQSDRFFVKGQKLSLKKLVNSEQLAQKYAGGALTLSRLCPVDYHRFHFPIDGIPTKAQLIQGSLLSVNPIALKQSIHILTQNKRYLIEIKDTPCGDVAMIPVGATCVGQVHFTYTPGQKIRKGDEAGYFAFGGSAVILIFQKDSIQLSKDITFYSQEGTEVYAKMGDVLGICLQ